MDDLLTPKRPDYYPVLMIQAFDYIDHKGGGGSKARIFEACKLIREGVVPHTSLVVWPQGYQKIDPLKKPVGRKESLGENLADFCTSLPEMEDTIVYAEPLSWGTLDDILAAYKMVSMSMHREKCPTGAHMYFVSDQTHLRRARLVWSMTHPPGWKASFHPTDMAVLSLFDRVVREPIALIVYFLTLLPGWLKRKKD